MSIPLLVTIELAPQHLSRLAAAGFETHYAPTASDRAQAVEHDGERIRAVLTNGSGLSARDSGTPETRHYLRAGCRV
jgi:hypothetical protein